LGDDAKIFGYFFSTATNRYRSKANLDKDAKIFVCAYKK